MIVANTTPLSNFIHLGLLAELRQLLGVVRVPPAVVRELEQGHGPLAEWLPETDPPVLEVRRVEPSGLLTELIASVHQGEAEAIALSLQLRARLLLMDDQDGRRAASRHQIPVSGTLAVLVSLKRHGLISGVRPHLESLRDEVGFWFTDALRDWALREAGE